MNAQRFQHTPTEETSFNLQHTNRRVELTNGSTLIDTETLTALIQNGNLIQTWQTAEWAFLATDIDEQFAFFEANDSWLIAVLNLHTGEWTADDDPLFIHYSLDEDAQGAFVLDERSKVRYRLQF